MSRILHTSFTIFILMSMACKSSNESNSTHDGNNKEQAEEASFTLPQWAKNSTIYEVNLRQFTEAGTINAFSDHIPRLKDMGVDILWLMPVFPISDTKKKGELGSYYAVTNYREVNPEFGTKKDLINLIDKIHAYQMKVILDWVPNHTGWDHIWLKNHPEYYTKDHDGNVTDPLNPDTGESYGWTDVADLNYDNIQMRKAMIEDLSYWVKEHGIDGYRMDIAFGVPDDFWQEANKELLSINPDLFLLAESEQPSHLNDDLFHACYAWSFHHLINDIANGKKKASAISEWRQNELSKFDKGSLMHFITNHDENSWNGSEIERMGLDAYQTFAALTFAMDGIPLIYSGQEEPLEKRLKFFEKDNINFTFFGAAEFYKDIITYKKNTPQLWNNPYGGQLEEFLSDNENIYAFKRCLEDECILAIFNLSNQNQKVTFSQDVHIEADLFKKTSQHFEKENSYYLEPWQFFIGK